MLNSIILEKFLTQSKSHSNEFLRKCDYVMNLGPSCYHFTASGILIHDNSCLLIFHKYLKRWLAPGGHIEYGENPIQAAQREVLEETGWYTKTDGCEIPVDIDIHLIPENKLKADDQHWHIDFAYILEPTHQTIPCDPEQMSWFDFRSVDDLRVSKILQKYLKI